MFLLEIQGNILLILEDRQKPITIRRMLQEPVLPRFRQDFCLLFLPEMWALGILFLE
jgi:hypothetical protein